MFDETLCVHLQLNLVLLSSVLNCISQLEWSGCFVSHNEEHELANASDMHHEKMYTCIAVSQEKFTR